MILHTIIIIIKLFLIMSFEEDKRNYPIYKQINWAQANEGGPTLGTLPHASSISKKTLD